MSDKTYIDNTELPSLSMRIVTDNGGFVSTHYELSASGETSEEARANLDHILLRTKEWKEHTENKKGVNYADRK